MAKDVIGIKFEVEGGGKIDGWSGKKIKNQLQSIVNQAKTKAKISVNTEHFDKQLNILHDKIQKKLGKLEIDLKYNKGDGVAAQKKAAQLNGKQTIANSQLSNFGKLQNQLTALYETYKNLDSIQESDINKRAEVISLVEQQEAAYEEAMQAARHSGEITEQQYNNLLRKEAQLLIARENNRRNAEKSEAGAKEDEKAVGDVVEKYTEWTEVAKALSKELKKLSNIKDVGSNAWTTQYENVENAFLDFDAAGANLEYGDYKTYAESIDKITQLSDKQKESVKKLVKELDNYQDIIKQKEDGRLFGKDLDDVNKLEKSYKGIIAKIENLRVSNAYLIGHNREAAAVMSELDDAMAEGFDGTSVGNAKKSIFDLDMALKEADAQLKQITVSADTFGYKIREAFETKVVQNLSYALLALTTNAFNQVYQNVVDLDKAVTDLQIATGKTREETVELVKQYAKLAQELGATATDVTYAADTWLRQGYKTAEVNTLIANTLKLAKLGQLGSAEAAKALTSAMKGYNYEVEKSIDIVDKFTAVDMEAATSAGDIATAMAETAVSANTAGVSMDSLIGYITTVSEVTQDGAESVGTFYKTMFARMSNIKAGKFVDDETGESLNDVAATLGKVGISLFKADGEFREFENVLDDLGAAWSNLDDVQKAAIATAMAGTRQQEKFKVLMEYYDSAKEYTETAANSKGTATSKYNEAYLDSLPAKLEQLQAAWQEFSANLLDSELVKGLVDGLKMVVNFLNSIVEIFDTGSIAATALFVIIERIGVKGVQYFANIVKEITEFPKAIKKAEAAAVSAKSKLTEFFSNNGNEMGAEQVEATIEGLENQTITTEELGEQLGLNAEQQKELDKLTQRQINSTNRLQKLQEKQALTFYNGLTTGLGVLNMITNALGSIEGTGWSVATSVVGMATTVASGVTTAFVAASKAISTAEKASIILTMLSIGASAISMVVNAFQEIAAAEEKEYEAAKKAYEEQKEAAKQKKKDAEDLNKLAEEYKELVKGQDDFNALEEETKERIKELQAEINMLATAEYKASDLINGTLEDRLKLLNDIIAAKDYEIGRAHV